MRSMKLVLSMAVLASAVAVQAATPQETADARHNNFKQIGGAAKAGFDQLKAPSADINVLKASATKIAALAPQVKGWFPAGTGPDKVKTQAKAAVWSDAAGFSAALNAFTKAAAEFKTAADSGNVDAAKAKLGALGGTCKGCHDKYREKD